MGIDVHKGDVSIGFVLPIYQDMVIKLDGDGYFELYLSNCDIFSEDLS